MSMTKNEIIDEEFSDYMIEKYSATEIKFIKDAMDEWAKEFTKEFIEWKEKTFPNAAFHDGLIDVFIQHKNQLP